MITAIGNKLEKRERGTGNGDVSAPVSLRCRCFPFPVPCSRRAQRANGFTLIEMLAVIVLIAIGVTIAAVSLHGRSRGQLDAAAQQVAAGLRDTRTRAMATSHPQGFTVDLGAHTFAAPGRDPRAFPKAAAVRVVSAAEDTVQSGVARIRFFPDGSSSGGHVELSQAHRTVRVDVDWLTGAVAVSDKP